MFSLTFSKLVFYTMIPIAREGFRPNESFFKVLSSAIISLSHEDFVPVIITPLYLKTFPRASDEIASIKSNLLRGGCITFSYEMPLSAIAFGWANFFPIPIFAHVLDGFWRIRNVLQIKTTTYEYKQRAGLDYSIFVELMPLQETRVC